MPMLVTRTFILVANATIDNAIQMFEYTNENNYELRILVRMPKFVYMHHGVQQPCPTQGNERVKHQQPKDDEFNRWGDTPVPQRSERVTYQRKTNECSNCVLNRNDKRSLVRPRSTCTSLCTTQARTGILYLDSTQWILVPCQVECGHMV